MDSERNELYLFIDDPNAMEDEETTADGNDRSALRRVHDSIPEFQRFYHHAGMPPEEKALELHALCVRIGEVIEEQARLEAAGAAGLHRRLMEGVCLHEDIPQDGGEPTRRVTVTIGGKAGACGDGFHRAVRAIFTFMSWS